MTFFHTIGHKWAFGTWSEWISMFILIGVLVWFIIWLVRKYQKPQDAPTTTKSTTDNGTKDPGNTTSTTNNDDHKQTETKNDSDNGFNWNIVWILIGVLAFLGLIAVIYFLRKRYKSRKWIGDMQSVFPVSDIKTRPVVGDGNCFYYSLAAALNPELDSKSSKVIEIGKEIKKHLSEMEKIVVDVDEELEKHFRTPFDYADPTLIYDRVLEYTKRPLEIIDIESKQILEFGNNIKGEAIQLVRSGQHFEPFAGGDLSGFKRYDNEKYIRSIYGV